MPEMFWFAFVILAFLAFLGVIFAVVIPALVAYREPVSVRCPLTHRDTEVRVSRWGALLGEFRSRRRLKVTSCPEWPSHAGCGQECVAESR
jgi:hypothetical protein